MADLLFQALRLDGRDAVAEFAERSGVPTERLRHYDERNILPPEPDLSRICAAAGLTATQLALQLGAVDRVLLERLRSKATEVAALLDSDAARGPADAAAPSPAGDAARGPAGDAGRDPAGDAACDPAAAGPRAPSVAAAPSPAAAATDRHPTLVHETPLGRLYRGDCLALLPLLAAESVDLVFADPPFNLNKLYPSGIDDDRKAREYLRWCEAWLGEAIRVLRPGGSLFVWNLPRWNVELAAWLSRRLTFRHWIAVDIKYGLPIPGRLYPSHYALIYFVKGPRPRVFAPDRLPMQVCPECAADLRDYGGYKDRMNPRGVNLTDVWYDIPPVRHSRYKKRDGANELSLRLVDRVLELASEEGDVVLDPFGGSGTTYAVAELKARRWIGVEIGPVDGIVARLSDLDEERARLAELRRGLNRLFTDETLAERNRRGLWTHETVRARAGRRGARAR